VYAWGWNEDGQVGDGTETQRKTPKIIEFKKLEQQETMIEISAGGWHSLALSNLGFVYAWGYNKDGRLGNYKNINQNVPKKIKFHHLKKSERIVKIKAGFYHNIAMTSLGNLYAWGSNEHGQIGDGTTLNRNHPVKVKLNGMDDSEYVVSFDVYKYHSVFKTNHNHFYACGLNQYGQLGDGTKTNRLQPTLVRLSFQENN
jgi:alpha-tubulin suppressor-like RCC1 family protein